MPVTRTARLPRAAIFGFGLLGALMTLPGQTAGVSAFIDYLIDAMTMSRSNLSIAYLVGTISSAFLLTPAGRIYDRWGSKITGTVVAAGLGVSLFILTLSPFTASHAASLGLSSTAAALLVMSFGFFLIRFFGQGMLLIVSKTMILKWFDDKRGVATAVFSSVLPLVFSLAPMAFNGLIIGLGWQGAWRLSALLLLPGLTVIIFLTYSDPPAETPGEGTTGTEGTSGGSTRRYVAKPPIPTVLVPLAGLARWFGFRRTQEPLSPPRDKTLNDALGLFPFWVILLVLTLSSGLLTGLTFHVVAIFEEGGISRTAALAVFFPSSVVSIAILPLASIASDFVRLKYFTVVHALALVGVMVCLPLLSRGPAFYVLIVIAQGIATAMFGINSSVVWPRFFGLANLGAITGFATTWTVAGSALGPYAYSLAMEITGSFYLVTYVFAPICLVLAGLAFRADNPNRGRKSTPG